MRAVEIDGSDEDDAQDAGVDLAQLGGGLAGGRQGGRPRADDQQATVHKGRQGGYGAGWPSCWTV